MAYRVHVRMGDALTSTVVGLEAIPTAGGSLIPGAVKTVENFDPLAAIEAGFQDVGNVAYNAATGNLTQDQINAIKAQTAATIAQASGGNAGLAASQTDQANQDINASIAQSYNAGPSNLLADLGLDSSAPGGSESTGLIGWIESNALILFIGVAAFVVFRPDKLFRR